MTSIALRKKVHQFIDNADDAEVKAIFSLLKKVEKGEPNSLERISLEQYNKNLALAEKEIASGKYFTHAQAVKEIRKW